MHAERAKGAPSKGPVTEPPRRWPRPGGWRCFCLAVVATLCAVAPSASADDWERGPKRGKRDRDKDEAKPKECTTHKLETPYRGVGYDHVVTLTNTCDHTEHCEIKASTNPETQELDVPRHSTRSVTVRRGSPARVFTAEVTCKKK